MKIKLGLLCCFLLCMGNSFGQNLQKFAFSAPNMGTTFRILIYAPDSSKARTAAQAAFLRIDQLNTIMSDYLPDSELNALRKFAGSKKSISVSEDLWKVLLRSHSYAKKSRGAFDITIGPLSQIWRRAMRKQAFPEADKLARARSQVGYKNVKLNRKSQSVRLKHKGMRLDLGGIAKGYAVDEALTVIQAHGYSRALVDGGGDIAIGDPPVGRESWEIEVPAYSFPQDEKKEHLLLNNCRIASSGDTYRFVELAGVRYSHIIDPRTGLGITNRRMLTVIAEDGMTADALASILSVLGNISEKKLRRKYKDKTIRIRFIEWN